MLELNITSMDLGRRQTALHRDFSYANATADDMLIVGQGRACCSGVGWDVDGVGCVVVV